MHPSAGALLTPSGPGWRQSHDTISPELLAKLDGTPGELEPRLTVAKARQGNPEYLRLDEASFRWQHNQDAMATDKLAEGIRVFYDDGKKLAAFAKQQLAQPA